jgi:hypothetical protein
MDGLTALWGRGIDLSDGISRIDHERITLLSGVFAHNRAFEVRCRFFRVQGLDDGWICDGLSGRFAPLVPANHSARLHDGERVTRATNPVASAPELELGGQARALPPTTRDAEQASPSTKTGAQSARCLSSLLANHGSAFWGDYPDKIGRVSGQCCRITPTATDRSPGTDTETKQPVASDVPPDTTQVSQHGKHSALRARYSPSNAQRASTW